MREKEKESLARAIKLVRFHHERANKPCPDIRFPDSEYADAHSLIFSYLNLLQENKLYKLCTKCEQPKVLAEYSLTSQKKLKSACRECERIYFRKYAAENRELITEQNIYREIAKAEKIQKEKLNSYRLKLKNK